VSALGSSVADVSIGPQGGFEGSYTCVRKTDSTVWCFGGANVFGTGGYGPNPVQITDLGTSAAQISVGGGFTCALKKDGTIWCWGQNDVGQLGDGSTTSSQKPVQAALDYTKPYTAVGAGSSHACGLRSDGTLWCWGGNSSGEVGIGVKTTAIPIPQLIIGLGSTTLDVVIGNRTSCAQKKDFTYWCWGDNGSGQIGNGNNSSVSAPAPVSTLSNTYFGVSVGSNHGCAIKALDGSLWCYGAQQTGQIGNGNSYGSNVCTQTPQFCTWQPTKTKLACP
jgi:alpha-tubulin suppressor-like RCC1 family protein